ncbi:hypothetical protein O4D10_14780 [Xanthomonas citri pv. citri]|uniref:hypothetical protein n=1 Tax=Xanthomonas citri TaxID=346 RepID=UPI0036DBC204
MARKIIGIVATILLIAPSCLQAIVWTPVNLIAASLAMGAFFFMVKIFPRWRWVSAIAASVFIAVPPYPNWMWASNEEGWTLRVGYKLQSFTHYAGQFGFYFFIYLILLTVISWSIDKGSVKVKLRDGGN